MLKTFIWWRYGVTRINFWFRLLVMWSRKQKKKKTPADSGKLTIRPDHPRRRIEVKVCMPGGFQCVVLYIKFYKNRSSGFAAVRGRKSPFPITLAIGLYNILYYRTSRDFQAVDSGRYANINCQIGVHAQTPRCGGGGRHVPHSCRWRLCLLRTGVR